MVQAIVPPFDEESARSKVQRAEDLWNTRDPEKVALAYVVDSEWRNRTEMFVGRDAIIAFLRRKWAKELDYRLHKELWGFRGNRMAVSFAVEDNLAYISHHIHSFFRDNVAPKSKH